MTHYGKGQLVQVRTEGGWLPGVVIDWEVGSAVGIVYVVAVPVVTGGQADLAQTRVMEQRLRSL